MNTDRSYSIQGIDGPSSKKIRGRHQSEAAASRFPGEMIAKANGNIRAAKIDNVEARKGLVEDLPVEDAPVNRVISNCVTNLSPEKPKVFREIYRVLKPGGRILFRRSSPEQRLEFHQKRQIPFDLVFPGHEGLLPVDLSPGYPQPHIGRGFDYHAGLVGRPFVE